MTKLPGGIRTHRKPAPFHGAHAESVRQSLSPVERFQRSNAIYRAFPRVRSLRERPWALELNPCGVQDINATTIEMRLVRGVYERGFAAKDVRQLFRLIDWLMVLPPPRRSATRSMLVTYGMHFSFCTQAKP